ncbi:FAD-binding domain-containing protein [uncultured Roseobacter sp.]|uniref:FAD-binding domain-containing protein n=1 Tax=uncultured Roseobacter sp. TaxID=114847 RepID=UPI0026388B1E|nr:FAD-binding domain-containing protein [uncultured Roseobacter sp.]
MLKWLPAALDAPDMNALEIFVPTRTAALERLARFLPDAGRNYAARRNYDLGPGAHAGVSTLSPYLRCRLITEAEVLEAVLARHSLTAAEKFVQEVFWRTYWKGWLELRPGVWQQYQQALHCDVDDLQTQAGLRDRWEAACTGNTGINCFDHWARELAQTGYLHNHARMWFASIWVFTLQLPWTLGADFFLRHLLDGDPASNTLSWRWVTGQQTLGKTYLARASNIEKYTEGRFRPQGLADAADAISPPPLPPIRALPEVAPLDPTLKTGLLLQGDDLSPGFLLDQITPTCTATLSLRNGISPLLPAPHVAAFRDAAAEDACARWSGRFGDPAETVRSAADILAWAQQQNLRQIVTAYAPVGPVAETLQQLQDHPDAPPLVPLRRAYDEAAWPLATKGFFPFKKHIPDLVSRLI